MRRQKLLAATLLATVIAACTPSSKMPKSTTTTPSPHSLLAAVIKTAQSNDGSPGWGMPIVAVLPGTIDIAMRDRFLSAAALAVTQVYPAVLTLGGKPEDAQGQVLKLMTAAVGGKRLKGLKVTMDSEPLPEMDGLYLDFNADKKLKLGQAYRLAVTIDGKAVTAGLMVPKGSTILEPGVAAKRSLSEELSIRWVPQASASAYQVDLAASGPGATADNAYSSPFLGGEVALHRIPVSKLTGPGAASIYLTSIGGMAAEDLTAGRSNIQGAGGIAVGMTTVERAILLEPAGSDSGT